VGIPLYMDIQTLKQVVGRKVVPLRLGDGRVELELDAPRGECSRESDTSEGVLRCFLSVPSFDFVFFDLSLAATWEASGSSIGGGGSGLGRAKR
jgi:hypothetical protein